jgi:type III restriction enzyme
VMKEDDFNQVFARVDEIRSDKTTIQAKIALHQRMANGTIKEKAYLFKPGESLRKKADRPEYETFIIDEISVIDQTVRFENGVELSVGQAQGADQGALYREQIRYTVEEHFRKQKRFRAAGIKVLSLFFIDRVENYAGDAPAGTADHDGLYPGIIRELFDEAFDDLKAGYPEFADKKAEEVRSAYFAQKNRKGGAVEQVDSTSGQSAEDRAAYALIMKDKERLMSFREPVAFIFSHSALREGWDSPNVCQICTLNQSVSEVKKRQEVGRGMRLVVNQQGARIGDEKLNVLTVIANESYEEFVEKLQAEMVEAFGKEGAPPRPVNARQKKIVQRKPLAELPQEFRDLWERIKHKTRYQVRIDTEKLLEEVVAALDKLTIDPPRIVAVKAALTVEGKDEFVGIQKTGMNTLATLVGRQPVPNLVEMLEDLIAHITPPIKLTRRTLAAIITRTKIRLAALDNPQEFAAQAARILRDKAIHQLVHGIQYERDGTWYELAEWAEAEERSGDRLVPVEKSIYDHVSCDSEVERDFVKKLGTREDVKLFVKLPAWFKVRTPVGNYNPDWGLVMEKTDSHGDAGPLLYLVRETKSETGEEGLRDAERMKVKCGEAHFVRALGVDYKVVPNADKLP